jgi:hypothetical protein
MTWRAISSRPYIEEVVADALAAAGAAADALVGLPAATAAAVMVGRCRLTLS